MKIQNELNLVSALILILFSAATLLAGVIMITRTVYDLNSRLLDLELANIMRKVESVYNILVDTDLDKVEKYVASAQDEIVRGFDGYQFGESGNLFIVDHDGRVVRHGRVSQGEHLDTPFVKTMMERGHGFLEYSYAGKARFCVFDSFAPWGWTIALSVTKAEMLAYRGLYVRIVTVVTASILILSIVIFILFSRAITGSIRTTLSTLKEVEGGNLNVRVTPTTHTEEIIALQHGINSMIAKIRERTEELLRSKEERMLIEKRLLLEQLQHKEAEISALQSQINPHFLYNTLECMNSIGAMHNVREIQEISMSLSHLFKYAVKGGKIVSVAEELQSVENYLQIQRIRFLDKFDMDISVEPSLFGLRMCKFLLQPIVENSIFHGLEPKLGRGRLYISGALTDGLMEFLVEDDGIGMDAESLERVRTALRGSELNGGPFAAAAAAERRSVGLSNIQNRIRLMYGEAYGLDIQSTFNGGTRVTMRLPRQEA